MSSVRILKPLEGDTNQQLGGINVDMLTVTSILENLPDKHFSSYKTLLSGVEKFWELHASRLPSEVGPKDVVIRAASLSLIRKNSDGSIDIVVSRAPRKSQVKSLKKKSETNLAVTS